MKQRYLVTYDICDPKRLRAVYHVMRGYGGHLQYSVFSCDLSLVRLAELKRDLLAVMDMRDDQVLFVDLGPASGRARDSIEVIGKGMHQIEDGAIIL